MANSRTTYTADGIEDTYTIGWGYTDSTFVLVKINGVASTGWDFSVDGLNVVFDTPPTADATILIYRRTNATDDGRKVSYSDGVFLDEASLDLAQRQTLHVTAENQDLADTWDEHTEDSTIHVPEGGDTNQVLSKDSAVTGDTSWKDGLIIDIDASPGGGVPTWPAGATGDDDLVVAVPTDENMILVSALSGSDVYCEWTTKGAGDGDVTGPASSVNLELALFDGTGGKDIIGGSGVVYDGSTTVTFGKNVTLSGTYALTTGGNVSIGNGLNVGGAGVCEGNFSVEGNLNMAGASTVIQDTYGSGTVTVDDDLFCTGGIETDTGKNITSGGNLTVASGIVTGAGVVIGASNLVVTNGNINVNGADKNININDGILTLSHASGSDGDVSITADSGGTSAGIRVGSGDPQGSITGTPGDLYIRVSGVNSNFYQHRGAAPSTTWTAI